MVYRSYTIIMGYIIDNLGWDYSTSTIRNFGVHQSSVTWPGKSQSTFIGCTFPPKNTRRNYAHVKTSKR